MIYIMTFVLLTAGLFNLASAFLQLPPYATARNLRRIRARPESLVSRLETLALLPLLRLIAPLLRIEPFKEKQLALQLGRAEIRLSPKEYYARALILALAAGLLAVAAAGVIMPSMIPLAVILAVIIYLHLIGEVKDKLKAKDRLIESELPRFVRAIVQGLQTEPDIIKLFENYLSIARSGLQYDLEILVMDLKSGNFETAMDSFDKRLGNAYVSRLTKALAAAEQGSNQEMALHHLMSDMSTLAHETLKRELDKRPGRVRMLVIPVVLLGVVTLFFTIGVHLFSSLGGLM